MIEVYVKNQYIEFIEKEVTTTNSLNYFKIHFLFDESWDKYVRHVTFFSTQKGERYVMQIKESNTVYVPNEVLKTNLPVYFGLYGENADGIRITTNTLQIPLVNSAYAPNSTVLDEDFVELRDFVKTEPDKIQYIREKDGVFEYSRDGVKWTQVRGKQGLGLPSGGEKNQYLVKSSINDYETEWKNFDNVVTEESNNGVSSKAVATFVKEEINNYDLENQETINNAIKEYDETIKSFIEDSNEELKDFVNNADNKVKDLIAQEDDKIKDFVVENDNQVKAFVEEEDNKVKNFVIEKQTELEALIVKGDNEVKQIVSSNYNELKTEQAKAIESIKVSTAKNTTELTKTNKQVVIDLTPFLSHLEIGDIKKDVANNSLRITPYEFKTEIERIILTATSANNGFMSKEDKVHLDTLYTLLGESTNDADSFVNTIREILVIFSQYPEGSNLINALGQKVDKETFNTAIQGINNTLNTKVDKENGKGLSTNDFTTSYKNQVDNSVDKNTFNENIQTLNNSLNKKVDKIEGKDLSTNDFTDAYLNQIKNSVNKDVFNENITVLSNQLANKVDKVIGKGLSTNDYTNEDKQKLDKKVDKVDGKQLSTNDFDNDYKKKVDNSVSQNALNDTLSNYLKETRRINGQELSKDLNVSVDKGSWKIGTQYFVGDMVSYGQLVWVCTTAHQPDDDDNFNVNFWKILSYHNEPSVGTQLGLFTWGEKQKLSLLPYNTKNKVLSTNDFTNGYKTKLENIQENATADSAIQLSKIQALFT